MAVKNQTPLSSANANNGANAGLTYVNANNSATNANANIGFHLSFFPRFLRPCHLAKNDLTHTSVGSYLSKKNESILLTLQVKVDDEMRVVFCGSQHLKNILESVPSESFPFIASITNDNSGYSLS